MATKNFELKELRECFGVEEIRGAIKEWEETGKLLYRYSDGVAEYVLELKIGDDGAPELWEHSKCLQDGCLWVEELISTGDDAIVEFFATICDHRLKWSQNFERVKKFLIQLLESL